MRHGCHRGARQTDAHRSATAPRATATTSRCAPEFKVFTNIFSTVVDSASDLDEKLPRRHQCRRLRHPAEQLRARPHAGVLPDPAQRADDLSAAIPHGAGSSSTSRPSSRSGKAVTLELSNTTPLPAKIHAVARAAPRWSSSRATRSARSATRNCGGKYQGQQGADTPGPDARQACSLTQDRAACKIYHPLTTRRGEPCDDARTKAATSKTFAG